MGKELNQNSVGGKSIKRILGSYGIVFVLIALIVVFAILSNRFLTPDNIFNILRQVSIVGIIAVGMTFIMLTGGIDLSVGSVAGFAGVGAALLMTEQSMNPVLAAIIMCLFGIGLGLANGFFISKLAVPPFIATLGMMVSIRGLAYIITGGLPVFGFDSSYTQLGQGYLGPIPIPVLIMAAVFIFGIIFPVSYTHLDGYKRQDGCGRAQGSTERAGPAYQPDRTRGGIYGIFCRACR